MLHQSQIPHSSFLDEVKKRHDVLQRIVSESIRMTRPLMMASSFHDTTNCILGIHPLTPNKIDLSLFLFPVGLLVASRTPPSLHPSWLLCQLESFDGMLRFDRAPYHRSPEASVCCQAGLIRPQARKMAVAARPLAAGSRRRRRRGPTCHPLRRCPRSCRSSARWDLSTKMG